MNKTVLITGASRGIGAATAYAFAMHGYNTVINYLNSEEQAQELLERIRARGGQARIFKADVSDPDQASALVEYSAHEYGRIDVLINNAGISCDRMLTDTSVSDWQKTFAVNVGGAFNCTLAVLPAMTARKCGRIINVSSIWGMVGASCEVAYSASKAAVIGFTKALAKEVGPSGITVNCVAPGVIDTDMNAGLSDDDVASLVDDTPLMRIGTPDDIAGAMLFLASDGAAFITGQVISPNGGFVI